MGKEMRGGEAEVEGRMARSHKVMGQDLGWALGVREFCLPPARPTQPSWFSFGLRTGSKVAF